MMTFEETGLLPELLMAVEELGFKEPTPIQEKTIPELLNTRNDIVALAQTGTGKTAAFGLPVIQQIDINDDRVQAIVLCPTRELCVQISKDLVNYSKYSKKIKIASVYGGANIATQIKALKDKVSIVVGTPGRVIDLIKRGVLKINNIKWLILDEADEMLNMGFKEDLDTILAATPNEKRTMLFSATMPREIATIAATYMENPVEISVGKRNIGAETLQHEYYVVHAKHRYEVLKRIADIHPNIYGIVFCRTRQETKEVADKLMNDGYNADALHGDLSQPQRDMVMNRFRQKYLQILVATDVAARGLDVSDLSHIINFNLPDDLEVYIHRSGRTGRAGKKGICISIIHTRETRKIRDLEKLAGTKFIRRLVPGGKEICEKQLFNLVDKVEKVEVDQSNIDDFLPVIYKKLEWLSREELIKHFISVEFNRFLSYYENAPDLNVDTNIVDRQDRQPNKRRENKIGYSRFFINLGTKNDLSAPRLIGLINEQTRSRDISIGKIDIMKKFSFFEVDTRFEKNIQQAFKNAVFEGEHVNVELSKPDTKGKQGPVADFPKKRNKRPRNKVRR
jgi:ATP-dependent RNA helicase DeaD